MFGTQISFGAIPEPETAYWVPACAHTLPQQGDGHCKVPPAVNPMLDLPASFGCRSMGCSGSGSTGATGCARRCTAAGNCDTEGYGSGFEGGHAGDCSLLGYWPLEGNGNDAGPRGNSMSPSWDTDDHLTNVVYNAGYRGLAYFGVEDQCLQVADPGESDFDVDYITMAAWVMPTAHSKIATLSRFVALCISLTLKASLFQPSCRAGLATPTRRSSSTRNPRTKSRSARRSAPPAVVPRWAR